MMTKIKYIGTKEYAKIKPIAIVAKYTLADIFAIDVAHFDVYNGRVADVVEARRFLIHYLMRQVGVRVSHVIYFLKALANHATAIHHAKKLDELFLQEKDLKVKYDIFVAMMDNYVDYETLTLKWLAVNLLDHYIKTNRNNANQLSKYKKEWMQAQALQD